MTGEEPNIIRVLLLETDPEKIFLIKELLKGIGPDFAVSVADGGRKAMEVLDRSIGGDARPFGLVILDSVRNEIEAAEIVAYMRSMHGLQGIPALILAKSASRIEEMQKRSGGTAHCILRPSSHAEFQAMQDLVRAVLKKE
jgi:CheY-like chemotaxis protein